MKILLINPPSLNPIKSCLPETIEKGRGFIPPLGLMSIASYLIKYTNHEVKIIDSQVEKLDYPNLENEIKKIKPDVVGITAMTFTLIDVLETLKIIKKIDRRIKTIVGGPHPTIYPEETAKLESVDFCVIGEGEKPVLELIQNINDIEKLKKIRGLAFQYGNEIINNGQTEFIQNLDKLPFPARHLVPYKKYFSSISSNFPITTMFTSRGCPYKCLFCDRPQLGKIFRARSPKNVVDEMEECKKMGIKEIFIYDDTFGVDKKRVIHICDEIMKRNLKIAWDVRTRIDTVDAELLTKMKKSGCQRIHYGVEAGTQKILDVLRKGITLEMVKEKFELTKKIGIEAEAYFMIGSPTETEKDILQTIKFMKEIKPAFVHITIATPFPATDFYKMAMEQKAVPRDIWKEFAKNPTKDFEPYFWEKELSREKLFSLLKKAYRSFYLRPSYIFKRIIQLKSGRDLIKKAVSALKIFKI